MLIAQRLREQNISAYIIYMFQVEDVIRAYQLDVDRLCAEYLTRFQYTEEQIAQQKEWYAQLISMMKDEGCEQQGHVRVVRNTLELLAERHQELLADKRQAVYSDAYYKALPCIVELRSHTGQKQKNEIENCLDALYGATVVKMQGRELTEQTRKALEPITQLLELLSQLYKEKD